MSAVGVVVPNVIDDRPAGLCARTEVLAVHAFDLERAVERFHRRVVPAIALSAHRHRDATRLQNLAVVTSGVLRSTVGVMHQPGIGVAQPSATRSASIVSSCGMLPLVAQPTILRANRSTTSARYSHPS